MVSKLDIIDLPGCEVLNEDPESLRVKQGSTLNKGILSLNNLLKELATIPHGDYLGISNLSCRMCLILYS